MATTEEQVSWNLSQKISEQIDSLLKAGRRNSVSGQVLECFFMFKEIRLLINHHFTKIQLEKANKLEGHINKLTIHLKKIGTIEEDEFEFDDNGSKLRNLKIKVILLKNERILTVEKYRKYILHLLDEYGYLMERKKDATQMW